MKVLELAQMCKYQGEQIFDNLFDYSSENPNCVKRMQIQRTITELRRNLSILNASLKHYNPHSPSEQMLPF